jgi:thiol:disulfide interchange protein DsbA
MPNLLRHWLLILLACTLPLVVQAADPPFQEGKDYVRLSTPAPPATSGKVEVIEMFWYGCPHCRDLEPATEEWLKRKPDNVEFTRIPVAFGTSWEPGARAYYAAEALGMLDKVHQPLFEAFHQRRKLNNVDQLAAFFAEHGVDPEAFRKAYQSFQTQTQLRRGNQLAQRFGVRGVPAIIVNGKYDVRSPRIFEVVDFLIAKEASPQS